ncbi:MAG TPA: ABC transporter ATP-binding protein [Actinomycetota bacterium]
MPVIELDNLTKRYGSARGVEDVTLRVEAGEVFGVLGPNGAGKTTLIRIMLDLIRPTSGTARLFGMDSRRDGVLLRHRVGYVPGEVRLDDRGTGAELLCHLAALRGGVDLSYAARLARRLQCDVDREIGSLSHGNRQKIVLLQAFMHRPDLVLLDEPTQGLDPLVQREVHEMIEDIREEGQTVLLSSHVLPEVEELCHRVAILREGHLAAVEPISALKARAIRTVEVRFAERVDAAVFARIPGVTNVRADTTTLRCSVTGTVDALVKVAARYQVVDWISSEPSLEDIFLAYYGEGEHDVA